jgi:histone-lysine N-methyltransferase SETMAR
MELKKVCARWVPRMLADAITKFGWTTLSQPPYSPDVAPSDYHLFVKLMEFLPRTRFKDNDALVMVTKQWLGYTGPGFYHAFC